MLDKLWLQHIYYIKYIQGPTVASAPSVEQEDYRTPKPSVISIGKNGKSFDFGEHNVTESTIASDSNALVKVNFFYKRNQILYCVAAIINLYFFQY